MAKATARRTPERTRSTNARGTGRAATRTGSGTRQRATSRAVRPEPQPSISRGKLVAGLVAAAVFFVWLVGLLFFQSHLFPRTYLNGQGIGLMSAQRAQSCALGDDWRLRVVEGEDQWEVTAAEVGLSADAVDLSAVLDRQNAAVWPFRLIAGRTDLTQNVSYSAEAVQAAVEALPFADTDTRVSPKDAGAVLSADGTQFVLAQEQAGTAVDTRQVSDAIMGELDRYRTDLAADAKRAEPLPVDRDGVPFYDIVGHHAYAQPIAAQGNDSLLAAIDEANTWLKTAVTYDIDGIDSAERVDSKLVAQWVTIEPEGGAAADDGSGTATDGTGATGDNGAGSASTSSGTTASNTFHAVLHEDLVRSWIAEIGAKYDTAFYGRTVQTGSGKSVFVAGGGTRGWLTDEATEYALLLDDIRTGRTAHRSFAMKQEAEVPTARSNDLYLEVSLADQHIWLFDGGRIIWDARTVTGDPEHPTVTGDFAIYTKSRNATLRGDKDEEGEYEYEEEVSYWMAFYGGYGLHDSPWRGDDPTSYGGTVYSWHGSHGCCNLRTEDAKYLYDKLDIGTPVYVH